MTTYLQLSIGMADYIENFDTPARRHSALDYLTPMSSKTYTQLTTSRPFCHNGLSTGWGIGQNGAEDGIRTPTLTLAR